MPAHEDHRHYAPKHLKIALITVSTSRYRAKLKGDEFTDEAGEAASRLVKDAGHKVVLRELIEDDPRLILGSLLKVLDGKSHAVILMGGTGLAKRDVTVETVRPLFDKEMEGFGEIFRAKSYQLIGAPAYLTRATAGIVGGKVIYCLPGSPAAVETALDLILSELPHAVYVAGD